MRRIGIGIVVSVLAGVLAGCGGTASDEGPGGFKPTDVQPLNPMVDQMKEVAKTKAYNKRPVEEKPKETDKKK